MELREAQVKDFRQCTSLCKRLIKHESELSDTPLVGDDELHETVKVAVAQAIMDKDYKTLVLEKDKRITGVFIGQIEHKPPWVAQSPVCFWWVAFARKSTVPFKKIEKTLVEWAKEKDCKAMTLQVVSENTRARKLAEKIGYKEIGSIYERAI